MLVYRPGDINSVAKPASHMIFIGFSSMSAPSAVALQPARR